MIRVIHIRDKGKFAGTDIYIGRPSCGRAGSVLQNKFMMRDTSDRERERVINEYRHWLEASCGRVDILAELERIRLLALKGDVNLMCFCAPKACHGDVIKGWVDSAIRQGFDFTPIEPPIEPTDPMQLILGS